MKEYFLKYKEFNICVYEDGIGEIPIVLLHGSGLDSAMLSWKEVMNLLPEKYKVYVIDLLGYGKSDKPENMAGNMFYEKHIDCLEYIVDELKLDKFILSGLSMGGAISIGYALKNPNKIKALIPVDSWGLVSKMPFHKLYYWLLNTSLIEKSFKLLGRYKWLIKPSIHYSLIGNKNKISEELVDSFYALCKDLNCMKSMEDFQHSSITKHNVIPDFTDKLQRISVPVLFINGNKDPLVSAKIALKASKKVKNGQLHIMKGCKHWSQKERPEEYVQVIDRFIGEL